GKYSAKSLWTWKPQARRGSISFSPESSIKKSASFCLGFLPFGLAIVALVFYIVELLDRCITTAFATAAAPAGKACRAKTFICFVDPDFAAAALRAARARAKRQERQHKNNQ
ncbi:MAG: hypothetical protein WAS33_27265, partial [Candidatus Promineifilaceae bacterium]